VQVHQRCARDVCALAPHVPPREARHAVLDGELHQPVIGGVVFDVVDAMPVAIVRVQARTVRVRRDAERHRLAAGDRSGGGDLLLGPPGAFANEGFSQREVGGIRIVRRQRGRLVLDVVRAEAVGDGHGSPRCWGRRGRARSESAQRLASRGEDTTPSPARSAIAPPD
jgi:hypothetical protein